MPYLEIARVFLRLGLFGFGGPIATMAMMEEEAVRKRGWITPAEFGEIYAVCKLLPGPVSSQMAIYLGRVRAGNAWGGLIAGTLFILPAFLMVLGLSALYRNTGVVSRLGPAMTGVQAAALVVILLSTWQLSKTYRKERRAWAIAALTAVIVMLHPGWEPLMILGFGIVGAVITKRHARRLIVGAGLGAGLSQALSSTGAQAAASSGWRALTDSVLAKLFWTCFKAGAFVFGTGLAVIPVLEAETVTKNAWLTHSQFMDGLAIGQVTPGPVVITSTFIGYLAAGGMGAIVATAGMFLPSFVNVLLVVPRIWKRFSGTAVAAGFLSWAIPAVIGGIAGTSTRLAQSVLVSWSALVIFVAAFGIAIWKRPPAWALIPGAGVLGALLGMF